MPKVKLKPDEIAALEKRGAIKPDTARKMRGDDRVAKAFSDFADLAVAMKKPIETNPPSDYDVGVGMGLPTLEEHRRRQGEERLREINRRQMAGELTPAQAESMARAEMDAADLPVGYWDDADVRGGDAERAKADVRAGQMAIHSYPQAAPQAVRGEQPVAGPARREPAPQMIAYEQMKPLPPQPTPDENERKRLLLALMQQGAPYGGR